MNVEDIVRERLEQLGADGLCGPYDECGCALDDLMCCGSCGGGCAPAKAKENEEGDTVYVPMTDES